MKRFFMLAIAAIFIAPSIFADNIKPRVAVFDPVFNTTTINESVKSSMREIIISTIVNSGEYNIVERSLLEKIIQEQEFSHSGVVDDSDAVEIGKLTGANKVVLTLISPTAATTGVLKSQNLLSIKVIDVKTASIERQKVQIITANDCLDVAGTLTNELLNGVAPAKQNAAAKETSASANEFVLFLEPQQVDEAHRDNYIEVLINGKTVGGGTLSKGFEVKITEKKPRKYKLEIRPVSVSDKGKTDAKAGMSKYEIDTRTQRVFEFILQTQHKGKWTIYSVLRK